MWFAFRIVSLTWLLQLLASFSFSAMGCDLLSELYLWLDYYSFELVNAVTFDVVICFQNCIFDLIITARWRRRPYKRQLWFAFRIVSLTWLLQPRLRNWMVCIRCDLLSELYLWLDYYSCRLKLSINARVVICFQNCIFDLIITAGNPWIPIELWLWFAFRIVSLTWLLQPRRTGKS